MSIPTLTKVKAAREKIDDFILTTPVWQWCNKELMDVLGTDMEVFLKLELFQHTGTFKARGALLNVLDMDTSARRKGITAVSAGNHAIAVAYAGQQLQTSAKVVMTDSANPARLSACRAYGAEIEQTENIYKSFDRVQQIEKEEGRSFIHPFNGALTILGTATVGYELCKQVSDLDAVIIPIGGGGLCAGVSSIVKQMQPNCKIYGVEPEGADTMHRSFESGKPESIDKIDTIADSLGAPYAEEYSFSLCYSHVDKLVKVSDDALKQAMALNFKGMKLALEPAGAAATAALCGPLRQELRGKRVGLIVCGANIDISTFSQYLNDIA